LKLLRKIHRLKSHLDWKEQHRNRFCSIVIGLASLILDLLTITALNGRTISLNILEK